MPDARSADHTLAADLVNFLADVEAWSRSHVMVACDCLVFNLRHEDRHGQLMQRKAELLARCRAQETPDLDPDPEPASTSVNRPLPLVADETDVDGGAGPGGAGEVAPGPAASTCRYAARAGHECRDSFGAPLRPGVWCFSEARAALKAMHPLAVGR